MRRCLPAIDGIDELHVELQVDVPQLEVEVDLAKAQQYGLKPGDVRRAAAYLGGGRRGGRHLRRRQGLRRERVEHARDIATA